jgi:hypothetical protein
LVQPPTVAPPVVVTPPPTMTPVLRQSNGAKSGINLLGDLERWALPDQDRVNVATFVFRGLSVKDLRELCTMLPPKLAAELQIATDPEGHAK